MKKFFAAVALLLPCLGFAQDQGISASVSMFALPIYSQLETGLVLRPLDTRVYFTNITPCDTAEMFVVPAGTAIDKTTGMPAQYHYRGNIIEMEKCSPAGCAVAADAKVSWDGKGNDKPVAADGKYPTGFEKLLQPGTYDIVWRVERVEGCSGSGVIGVKSGTIEIKNIDNMENGTDGSSVKINHDTVIVMPTYAKFDDLNNPPAKVSVQLSKDVTAAAVFVTPVAANTGSSPGLRMYPEQSMHAPSGINLDVSLLAVVADKGNIQDVPLTLSGLKSGAELIPPPYIWTYGVPRNFSQSGAGFYTYLDDCLGAYVIKEGSYNFTVVYLLNENVYYQSAVYTIKYSLDTTGITPVAKRVCKVYPNPTRDIVHVEGDDIKTIRLLNINGALLQQAKDNRKELDLSRYPIGTYLLNVDGKTYPVIKQ